MEQLIQNQWIIVALALWTLPWKGWALWIAARKTSKIWFIVLLVLNTLAILDILYIFVFSKEKKSDNKDDKNSEIKDHNQEL